MGNTEGGGWPGYQPAQPNPTYERSRSLGMKLILVAVCLLLVWIALELSGFKGLKPKAPKPGTAVVYDARGPRRGLLRRWAETWGLLEPLPEPPTYIPPPPPEFNPEAKTPEPENGPERTGPAAGRWR